MDLLRTLKHLLIPQWRVRQIFTTAMRQAVEAAIAASEQQHSGELRFVVEGSLPTAYLWCGISPRQRALDLFAQLRVWDTAANSGILIYVQCVDHAVEIVADRGIAAQVPQVEWEAICHDMETAFGRGEYQSGSLAAIERASHLLSRHFPVSSADRNELPDPLLLM